MTRFLIRRTLLAVLALFCISVTTFLLFFAGPANPAAAMCGDRACPAERLERINKSLGLDEPLHEQYVAYMRGIFAGRQVGEIHCPAPCLGVSFRNDEPVTDIIARGMPVTASVAIGATVFSVLIGVGLGVVSALRQGRLADKVSIGITLTGASLQVFFLGLLVQQVFVYQLKLIPTPKYHSPAEDFGGWLLGMLLPWVTLGFLNAAAYARYVRSELSEVLSEDFIRTARAKGLGQRAVTVRHALRAVLAPLLTITAIQLGGSLGGYIIAENVFNMRGIGQISIEALADDNLPVIMATVLIGAVFIVVFNLVCDLLYAAADPRVRIR
ncbi:ABC transporter permease [Longispora albida]|uniref:ABC transporter permease n=1 Tax=Longispora albida TaxID=203523 RepID=UPI000379F5B2|nr:ABC transporter permease [Longispora albida]